MDINLENKLNLYKLKIEKYKEKIEELEGGAISKGIKMIVFKNTDKDKVQGVLNNKEFTTNDLLNILNNNSFIIDVDSQDAVLFSSDVNITCDIAKALNILEKKLKDGDYKTNFRKNIINELNELPNESIKLDSKLTLAQDKYDLILNKIKEKYPFLNTYAVINFKVGWDININWKSLKTSSGSKNLNDVIVQPIQP